MTNGILDFRCSLFFGFCHVRSGLTWKTEPPPARGANRDSGTDSANGICIRLHHRLNIQSKKLAKIQMKGIPEAIKCFSSNPRMIAEIRNRNP
jgi:hypothetical protein